MHDKSQLKIDPRSALKLTIKHFPGLSQKIKPTEYIRWLIYDDWLMMHYFKTNSCSTIFL